MARNSIAQNHLSFLSSQGRGGDTELRFIDGELSHVNSGEASLADIYGSSGEDVVKFVGSGGINPYTGLREYQPEEDQKVGTSKVPGEEAGFGWGDLFSWGALGLSAIEGISGAKKTRAEGHRKLGALGQESIAVDLAGKKLVKAKETKEESVSADFVSGTTALGGKIGSTERGIKKALESTGLVKSTGISDIEFQSEQEFDISKGNLYTQLDKSMGNVAGWFAGEQGKLSAQRRQIDAQKREAEAMTKEKWLGIV